MRDPAVERLQATLPSRALVRLLRDGIAVEFVAMGGSMWPTIRAGSLVRIEPCDASTIQLGEIAAYESAAGSIVVHRVMERLPDARLVLRGDALADPDIPVAPDAVLGSAVVVRQKPLPWRRPRADEWPLIARAAYRALRRRVGWPA